ncbi:MAG: ATP synthase F1 subunit delta [Hyphomicrobiales bacterium]
MISVTLSRRYARALLQLATRQGEIDRAHDELATVAGLAARDPRLRRFFESPNVPHQEKLRFLEEGWKPRLCRSVYGLLMVLLRRRRLDHLISIGDEFHKLAERAQGIGRATVRTAVPLSDAQADALTKALAARTGLKVLLTREVDARLIGGAVVSLDHHVIDGTLATELWRIKRQLLSARVHGRG